jgi:hypothetical protein
MKKRMAKINAYVRDSPKERFSLPAVIWHIVQHFLWTCIIHTGSFFIG